MADKKPVDKHSFVQVFNGREDTLQDNIVALFELMGRKGIAFSTPGERKRFEAAYDAIKKADIVVDDAKVKIITNAKDAQKIAEALATPNENGDLVAPSVNDVLDAEKLPGLILNYATCTETFKSAMRSINENREKVVASLEAEKESHIQQISELAKEVQATSRAAQELLEKNQELEAQNSELDRQNKLLYDGAYYVNKKKGKVVAAKRANRISQAIAGFLFITTVASAAIGIGLGAKNGKLKADYANLESEYAVVFNLSKEQQKEISRILADNQLLQGQNKTLENANAVLTSENEGLKNEVEDLKDDIDALNDKIEANKDRYDAVVDKAQQAGILVADDVKIEDLFDAMMASIDNGASADVKAVYAQVLTLMADNGITKDQITDANGNYTSDKINAQLKNIFDKAVVNAQIVANNEAVIEEGLEGTGKTRADFGTQAEAIKFIAEKDEQEIEDLKKQVADKQEIINRKNNKINQLEDTISDLEATIEYLENNGGGTDNSELVAELQSQLASTQSQLASTESELASAESELATTKSALNSVIAERDAYKKEAEIAKGEAAAAKSAYDALVTYANDVVAENERLKQAYEDLLNNQGSSTTQTPTESPSENPNSGNVNVGDVDENDENVNEGQNDKKPENIHKPGEELGDE